MTEPAAGLMDKIAKLLDEHGVSQWIVVFSDPDSPFDRVEFKGSKYWRAGVGMDLVDEVKEARRIERQADREGN